MIIMPLAFSLLPRGCSSTALLLRCPLPSAPTLLNLCSPVPSHATDCTETPAKPDCSLRSAHLDGTETMHQYCPWCPVRCPQLRHCWLRCSPLSLSTHQAVNGREAQAGVQKLREGLSTAGDDGPVT